MKTYLNQAMDSKLAKVLIIAVLIYSCVIALASILIVGIL